MIPRLGGMACLVTGGSGFIGGHLVEGLIKQGVRRVAVLDKLTYAASVDSVPSGVPIHIGSVEEVKTVYDSIIDSDSDIVFHLAAETHVLTSTQDPARFVRANVQGTFGALEGARLHWDKLPDERRKVFRFVHVSTDEVYGPHSGLGHPFQEGSPHRPSTPYAASKVGAEALVRAYHLTFGLPVVIVRPSNCYGPRQYKEKFIPILLDRISRGDTIELHGDGKHSRTWIYVKDVVDGLIKVSQSKPGSVYNLGGLHVLTNEEMVYRVWQALDVEMKLRSPECQGVNQGVEIVHVDDRLGNDRSYRVDSYHARVSLGWGPVVTLSEGLRLTAKWYLDQQ